MSRTLLALAALVLAALALSACASKRDCPTDRNPAADCQTLGCPEGETCVMPDEPSDFGPSSCNCDRRTGDWSPCTADVTPKHECAPAPGEPESAPDV